MTALLGVLAVVCLAGSFVSINKAIDRSGRPAVAFVLLALVFLYGAFFFAIDFGDHLDRRRPAVVSNGCSR